MTLHLQIMDKREPIKGVPAVYYVEPTEENVRRIVRDCSAPIYEINYINFSSSISRELMTLFAQLCVENQCAQRINRVLPPVSLHPRCTTAVSVASRWSPRCSPSSVTMSTR